MGVALALTINEVPIALPAPGYLIGSYTYFPARPVLEKLKRQVRWDAATGTLTVSSAGAPTFVLTAGRAAMTSRGPGSSVAHETSLPVAPRIIGHLFYVPTCAISLIVDGGAGWDPERLIVGLSVSPWDIVAH
jgi:hypothetical protein